MPHRTSEEWSVSNDQLVLRSPGAGCLLITIMEFPSATGGEVHLFFLVQDYQIRFSLF